jgi:hypothetical protein
MRLDDVTAMAVIYTGIWDPMPCSVVENDVYEENLACFFPVLKLEPVYSFETLVPVSQITRCHIPHMNKRHVHKKTCSETSGNLRCDFGHFSHVAAR